MSWTPVWLLGTCATVQQDTLDRTASKTSMSALMVRGVGGRGGIEWGRNGRRQVELDERGKEGGG